MDVLITGVVSGIALAIPLGPMALLLISTTLQHGRNIGAFGALAMASVDFGYALITFAFGSIITDALSQFIWPLRIAGSIFLIVIAVQNFRAAKKELTIDSVTATEASALKTYAKFFGLTVINPATAFYFLAITPSVAILSQSSDRAPGIFAFAIGVFLGSIVWQLTLVAAATLTRSFTKPKVQANLRMIGAGLIAILAAALLLR